MSRIVVVKGPSGLRQTVTIGPHQLLADGAKDVGSNDEGHDPYDYLLAALGTCTNMTLRMYADRKGWPLREIPLCLIRKATQLTASIADSLARWSTELIGRSRFSASCRESSAAGCCKSQIAARCIER